MHDAPSPLFWTDPTTGICYVFDQNTPHAEGEVIAFEPRGVLPDAQTERTALQGVVNRGQIIIAYQPPLKVEASGPKNIVANAGEPVAVICAAEGYQCESMTAVVRVADPGEIAGIVDTNVPIVAGSTAATTYGPSNTDPFTAAAAPAALGLPANILQQIEVLGYLIQGHEDLSHEIPFNMPVGQLIRLQATGSSIKVKAMLIPRYFQKFGSGSDFQYMVAGTTLAADRLRNNLFNYPTNTLAANLTTVGMPTTPVQVQGYVGRGFTDPVPPQRIFFGAFDAGVAQNVRMRCPVGKGAQTVFLCSDGSAANNDPAAGAGFAGVTLMFAQICGNNGRRTLNYPANTTIPLRSDCTAIEVVNVTNGAAVPEGVPFEVHFDVGF